MGVGVVPAVHGRDARARRLSALGRHAGRLRAPPSWLRRACRRRRRRTPYRRTNRRPPRRRGLLRAAVHALADDVDVRRALGLALAIGLWRVGNLWRFAETGQTWCVGIAGLFAGAAAGMKYTGAAAAVVLALVAAYLLKGTPAAEAPLRLRRAGRRRGAAVVRQEHDPDREPGVSAASSGRSTRRRPWSLETVLAADGHGRSPLGRAASSRTPARGRRRIRPRRPDLTAVLPLCPADAAAPSAARCRTAGVGGYRCVPGVAWFAGSQQARFLVGLMPVLAVLAALAIVAVARAGRLGRVVTVAIVSAAFVSGLGVSTLYASRFAKVAVGLEGEETFLRRTAPYHDAAEWASRNLPADAHVLSDPRAVLHLERPSVTWTPSALPQRRRSGHEGLRARSRPDACAGVRDQRATRPPGRTRRRPGDWARHCAHGHLAHSRRTRPTRDRARLFAEAGGRLAACTRRVASAVRSPAASGDGQSVQGRASRARARGSRMQTRRPSTSECTRL